jgi:hypothetical protein
MTWRIKELALGAKSKLAIRHLQLREGRYFDSAVLRFRKITPLFKEMSPSLYFMETGVIVDASYQFLCENSIAFV